MGFQTFQTAKTIPYRPEECPKCKHLLGSGAQGACEGYGSPSYPLPMAAQFSGQAKGKCPKFEAK